MRLVAFVFVGLMLAGLQSGNESTSIAQAPAMAKGLSVHEWGVVSAYGDTELANADMRAEWGGLPKFVYGQIDGRKIPERNMAVRAPVMYFHTEQSLTLNIKVDFPKGKPVVWWPANSNAGFRGEGAAPLTFLQWNVQVKPTNAAQIKLMDLPRNHWLEALRDVKAEDIVSFDQSTGQQKERFIYYDGLIPAPKGLTVRVDKDKVALKSAAKHALHDVTVVDLRNVRKIRVARIAQLDAEAEVKDVEFKEGDQTKWPADAVDTLIGQLKAAGLNEDEAKALAVVWRKDFFETEGLSVFYRLPTEIYDQMLPLTVTPKPEKTVRVLLVHHPHCEPDLAERVLALVKQLGAAKFEERLDAQRRLQALGRAAFVHLKRAHKESTDPEVSARLKKLLEEFEAEQGIGK
ncbi:MAG: hypothetical protein K2R98_08395 [Gemmataceae bacterium]|nr:hypothetical protein [Gemmataceae bacterium]